MDTCLVPGNQTVTWSSAWMTCYQQSSRLLEIPNNTYDSAYGGLSSPLFTPSADARWLGFMRNLSSTTIREWLHGGLAEIATGTPTIATVTSSGPYPFCGYITKISGRTTAAWAERSCSGAISPFFCQFLLAEGNQFLLLYKDGINH